MAKILLAATAFLLVLGGGEIVYRVRAASKYREFLAGRDPADLVIEAAPAPLRYRLKPNFPGFTNAAGFRDLDRSVERREKVRRIAVIGDSVSMHGRLPFEELYVRHLQRKFDAEYPGDVEVLNFAVTGYNSEQEAAMLEQEVLEYEPDLVLWQLHDNDGQHALYSAAPGSFYERPTSYLVSHVADKLYHFFCRQKIERSPLAPVNGDQRNLICRWESMQEEFDRVVAKLDSLGIDLLVFLYPSWPDGDDWQNYGDAGYELHRKLVSSLEARDVRVVDLLDKFVQLDPASYRVEPTDPWHCNAAAHEIIAETIFDAARDALFSGERRL